MNITACLIVWNEEPNIRACLESIKNIVSEIVVVVDDRTTDNTAAICKEYTSNVFFKKWDDHFANTRNFAISKATGDYILTIDGDEVLSNWHELGEYDFYVCKYVIGNAPRQHTGDTIRIFRNNGVIKYEGKRHGVVDYTCKGFKGAHTNIQFLHPELTKEELDAKVEKNIKIHYEQLETEPDNPTIHYHLTRCHVYQGNWERVYEHGIRAIDSEINNAYKAVTCIEVFNALNKLGVFKPEYLYMSIRLIPAQVKGRLMCAEILAKNGDKETANGQIDIASVVCSNKASKLPNDIYYDTEQLNTIRRQLNGLQ